jgi:hypothetical protein
MSHYGFKKVPKYELIAWQTSEYDPQAAVFLCVFIIDLHLSSYQIIVVALFLTWILLDLAKFSLEMTRIIYFKHESIIFSKYDSFNDILYQNEHEATINKLHSEMSPLKYTWVINWGFSSLILEIWRLVIDFYNITLCLCRSVNIVCVNIKFIFGNLGLP